ncbi:MAG: DMT family transporter [Rhizobium sp.]|nr:DMT family transporter [Rhizobium sp.]MBW8321432.1 DMT family transporter [Rhizobium sp.]
MAVSSSSPVPAARPWLGIALVLGSALAWSYGGAIQRFIGLTDGWAIVFWRCLFGGLFLLVFMLIRDGFAGTIRLFRAMGWPGLMVAAGFAAVSTCFVLAVSMTPVANVVLFMAAIPLFAALLARVVLGEPITAVTWGAIGAVIIGVAIMVSAAIAATQAGAFAVSAQDLALLFAFGALNLGLGMAMYVTGARMIPSALAALLGTAEMILAPVWMVLLHQEVPSVRTMIGGGIVLAALFTYLIGHMQSDQRPRVPPAS